MTDLKLPKIYTKKDWERGGKIRNHKQYIGSPRISWSQVEVFRKKPEEYIMKYLLGDDPAPEWLCYFADFGLEAENYICERKDGDKFSTEEKKVLETVKPYGVFQTEIVLPLDGFVLLGYADDHTKPKKKVITNIRDIKTRSESSKKDLHSPDKLQLDLYIAGLNNDGFEVKEAEYCIVERLGGKECVNGGGRSVLTVGSRVWYEPYSFSDKTIERAKRILQETAEEISEIYKTFVYLQS